MKKIIFNFITALILFTICFSCISCTKNDKININSEWRLNQENLKVSAPEGTPALAILKLVTDNKTIAGTQMNYQIVNPSNIALEMSSQKSDIVIMPLNAGANLIRQGANYKLISIAVDGSLFLIGNNANNSSDITPTDLIGKKIACIGKTAIPGLIFRYVMRNLNINLIETGTPNIENNEVLVEYVADGGVAKTLLVSNKVDFAVVGEPAATTLKNALSLKGEMNLQTEFGKINNSNNYPQAGLFVRAELASDEIFLNELFNALNANKNWIASNPNEITNIAKQSLYENASFPAGSIPRCAINTSKLTSENQKDIIEFLNIIMPNDPQGNTINWSALEKKLF